MSKPIARVTLVILISLVLIAATSASARSWLGGTSETAGVQQAHTVNGLQTNFNHQRSTASERESQEVQQLQETQPGKSHQGGGGCESENPNNSSDL